MDKEKKSGSVRSTPEIGEKRGLSPVVVSPVVVKIEKYVVCQLLFCFLAISNASAGDEPGGYSLPSQNQPHSTKETHSNLCLNDSNEFLASIKKLAITTPLSLENIINEFGWPVTHQLEIKDQAGEIYIRTSFNICPKDINIPLAEFLEDKKEFWISIPKNLRCIRSDEVLREFGDSYMLHPPVAIDFVDQQTRSLPQSLTNNIKAFGFGPTYKFDKTETRSIVKFGFFSSECVKTVTLIEEQKGGN